MKIISGDSSIGNISNSFKTLIEYNYNLLNKLKFSGPNSRLDLT